MKTIRRVAPGLLTLTIVLPVLLPSGAAYADEANRGSHNGPRVALISTGQIDDPMEDVLEHVAILGRNIVSG
ncbi:hypothetical protein [Streptomyces sp. NPDC047928]|uniref:hypothetical protein n=1 Tax=unclassified Streptomyces TaxID=2593676 RepID=UPI0037245171